MSEQGTLAVTKPVAEWNKPIRVKYKDLFIALGKTVVQGVVGVTTSEPKSLVGAIKSTIDAFSAFEEVDLSEFLDDPGQVAWMLIHRALLRAIGDLIAENADLFTKQPDPEAHVDDLDLSLEQVEVHIDATFFLHPKNLGFLEAMQETFSEWLQGFGLTEAQAHSISGRLPSYFVFSLSREWGERPEDYAGLKAALDTPFTQAERRERAWIDYRAWLQKQVDERMFDEAFSLRQVYVPLRAYYEKKKEDNEKPEPRRRHAFVHEREKRRVVVSLDETLNDWIQQADKKDPIRVISGGPGSGKSSCTKMLAARLAEAGDVPVLYVPLHHFELADALEDAVGAFVRDADLLPHNPLDAENGEARLLLIFDGLDELSMQGRVGVETAQRFVREVGRKVRQYNLREPRVMVLMSGREVVVQANADEWRKPEQVLHLLPYYIPEDQRKQYDDPQELLAEDQRQHWWTQYGAAKGESFTGMPEELDKQDLGEITTQPLLNYLVALSWARDEIDFSETTSLNAIYADLLAAIYERGWGPHAHPATEGLNEDEFIRILEEIALSAWHGDGRKTTVRSIKAHCQGSGLMPLLERFQEGVIPQEGSGRQQNVRSGVTRLLTAFYFRQSGRDQRGDQTFEFTHKSFGEYLTARRLVGALQRIRQMRMRRQESYEDGWDERECLHYWAVLCGPSAMDEYLFRFLIEEVRLQDVREVSAWQDDLCAMINHLLRQGMPIERLEERPIYNEESRQVRNAEEALIAVLGACASEAKEISPIRWTGYREFGTWLQKLHGQRSAVTDPPFVLRTLRYLKVDVQELVYQDLRGADLSHSDLEASDLRGVIGHGAKFCYANLRHANLRFADMQSADLQSVDLQDASGSEAKFARANLEHGDLRGANLQAAYFWDAILKNADLRQANISWSYFQNAELQDANLEGASVRRANLQGANLKGVDLRGVNLKSANLQEANLRNANLWGCDLRGANLRYSDLRGANLEGINFREIEVQGVVLRGADLRGMDFRGTDLRGADLRGADLRGTRFQDASVRGVLFREADMDGADFRCADFLGVRLNGIDLRGADLKGARIMGAYLEGSIIDSKTSLTKG